MTKPSAATPQTTASGRLPMSAMPAEKTSMSRMQPTSAPVGIRRIKSLNDGKIIGAEIRNSLVNTFQKGIP